MQCAWLLRPGRIATDGRRGQKRFEKKGSCSSHPALIPNNQFLIKVINSTCYKLEYYYHYVLVLEKSFYLFFIELQLHSFLSQRDFKNELKLCQLILTKLIELSPSSSIDSFSLIFYSYKLPLNIFQVSFWLKHSFSLYF